MQSIQKSVDAARAFEELVYSKGTLLIDVRSKAEFLVEHAQGAVNIPLEQLGMERVQGRFPGWQPDIRPVFLVSGSGRRATRAAERLRQQGITNLAIVKGGMRAWREAFTLGDASSSNQHETAGPVRARRGNTFHFAERRA